MELTEVSDDLLVEYDGEITWLTLNRPEKLNALNSNIFNKLSEALNSERTSPSRVIVIRGAGRAFSAGHDLGSDAAEVTEPGDSIADRNRQSGYLDVFFQIWDHPKPVLAAIHGYCIAGATQLATFCDLIVTADDAKISASPLLPLGGGFITPLMSYKVGPARAKMLSFIPGYKISGVEAVEWGWATLSVPEVDLESKVRELAHSIARTPSGILQMKKRAINRVLELQGFRTTAYIGAETDVVVHGSDEVGYYKGLIHRDGLKATLLRFKNEEI